MAVVGPEADESIAATQYGAERWMGALPDAKRLADVNIPGTHDSGAIAKGLSKYLCFHLWSRQSRTITQQLRAGIRILDLRIQATRKRNVSEDVPVSRAFDFDIVHGGVLAALNLNRYQSFDSVISECADFLRANASEVLVVSLKIDNWKRFEVDRKAVRTLQQEQALAALREPLNAYSDVFGHFVNKPDDVPEAVYVGQATLGDLRGKMVFFNRIEGLNAADGADEIPAIPFDVPDNVEGVLLPGTAIFLQDRYEELSAEGKNEAKLALVNRAFDYKRDNPDTAVWSFASATREKLLLVNVHYAILRQFGALPTDARKTRLGWILFDFAVSTRFFFRDAKRVRKPIDVVSFIIDSNFGYPVYKEVFDVKARFSIAK